MPKKSSSQNAFRWRRLKKLRAAATPLSRTISVSPVWIVYFVSAALAACAYNPAIARDQFILVPDAQLVSMASSSWATIKSETPVSQDRAKTQRARRVAGRILQNMGEDPNAWDIQVFEDQSLNAFALPGGKIGVHTAMLDFCRTDDELAAVIGHEIAHVKLRHAAERMSQELAAQGAIDILYPNDENTAALLGAGATLGIILPFSRKHEHEADRLGLQYMADAGFDPMEAVTLWSRMAAQEGRQKTPVWLSTHPADQERIEAIRREALRLKSQAR